MFCSYNTNQLKLTKQWLVFACGMATYVIDVFIYSKAHAVGSSKALWGKIILSSWRSPIQGRLVLFNSQSAALIHPNAIMELISCLYFPRHFTHYTNMTVESGPHSGKIVSTLGPWLCPYTNTYKYTHTIKGDNCKNMLKGLHGGI